jgi:hypothetical protein
MCTISGKVEKVLDVAGFGYTKFDTCNIVINGCWLFLAGPGTGGLYGATSIFLFKNVKGEPYNSAALPGGSISQLVVAEAASVNVSADIHFEGSGFSSGVAFDPASYQIDITPIVRIHWNGGNLQTTAKIRSTGATVGSEAAMRNRSGILFENMRSVPLPDKVTFAAGPGGSGHGSVTWLNCLGGLHNMTIASPYASPHRARQTHRIMTAASGTIATNGTANIDMPFYTYRQRVIEVLLHLNAKTGNDLTLSVYSNAARSTLLATVTLTSADNVATPLFRRLAAAADAYVTEGLYFTITATATHTGYIQATYEAS